MTAGPATDPTALVAAARATGLELPLVVAERVARYLDAMLEENTRVNLTAIRDPEHALWLHAVDSLAVLRAIDELPRAVFDLGTGNGFPGVAAAAAWPDARVVLCDRTRKKVDAVGRALERAGIRAEPLWLDAGQVRAQRPELLGAFDAVLARAVADPLTVARTALPLLAPGGRLVLWLTAEEHPPVMLPGGIRKERRVPYTLPIPDPRARAVAAWHLP